MSKIYFDNKVSYDWIRYKDGYWISHRKRVYLYWFKYLQHAGKCDDYTVDWTQYSGWGGANAVLGMKFDEWWNDNWIELFGTKDRRATPKYPINTKQPKTEAIRLSMLCWERRDAPVWNKRGNALSIAKQVYEYETGESGEKKPRFTDENWDASFMLPETFLIDKDGEKYRFDEDGLKISWDDVRNQRLQSIVARYLKNARKYLDNVCIGKFP
jgi:hypothetical protein